MRGASRIDTESEMLKASRLTALAVKTRLAALMKCPARAVREKKRKKKRQRHLKIAASFGSTPRVSCRRTATEGARAIQRLLSFSRSRIQSERQRFAFPGEGTPPLRGAGCRRTATDEVSRFALLGVKWGCLKSQLFKQPRKFGGRESAEFAREFRFFAAIQFGFR